MQNWSNNFLLGDKAVDEMHEEFIHLLGLAQSASDEDLSMHYEELLKHLTRHFDSENKMMEATEFPPRQCHIDEHAEVIKSVMLVDIELGKGNIALCRRLMAELAVWFPKHVQHLDSALVHWICKQRTGARPVVVKRNILQF